MEKTWKRGSQKMVKANVFNALKICSRRERPASWPLDDGAKQLSYQYNPNKSIALKIRPYFLFENRGFFTWKKRGKSFEAVS